MTARLFLAAVAVLALTACNPGPTMGNLACGPAERKA